PSMAWCKASRSAMSTSVPPLWNVGRGGTSSRFRWDRNSPRRAVSTSSDIVRFLPRGLTLELSHDGVVDIEGRFHKENHINGTVILQWGMIPGSSAGCCAGAGLDLQRSRQWR